MKLSNITHDIKRNLSSIKAGTELLKRSKDKGLVNGEIIDEMSIQTAQTLDLIKNLFENFEIKEKGMQK